MCVLCVFCPWIICNGTICGKTLWYTTRRLDSNFIYNVNSNMLVQYLSPFVCFLIFIYINLHNE